jgi:hypothetical protein
MRSSAVSPLTLPVVLAIVWLSSSSASAQGPPPPIPRFVVDLRGIVPKFSGDQQLAASRQLDQRELPGVGVGVDGGAHLYLFTWKALTVGIGGQVTLARSHSSASNRPGDVPLRAVTEQFRSIAPQLSLNFGTGEGWSYLSGGIGRSRRSIVPDEANPRPADEQELPTINYGGGARWFLTPRMAFNLDVRLYAIDPGVPGVNGVGSPRATLLIIGAGISLK